MNTPTTSSRIDRIKRRQAAAANGAFRGDGAMTPVSAPNAPVSEFDKEGPTLASASSANSSWAGAGPSVSEGFTDAQGLNALFGGLGVSDRDRGILLQAEFMEVLEAIAVLHGYLPDDKAFVRDYFLRKGVDLGTDEAARTAVATQIRGWHVDLISMGWMPRAGQEALRARAMVTFRRAVMGEIRDENGDLYPGVAATQFEESIAIKAPVAAKPAARRRRPGS